MQKNVLEYLENIVTQYPNKTAYADDKSRMTFNEVFSCSRAIGTFFHKNSYEREPLIVFMGRHIETIAAYYGVVYSGCSYVPIDEEMPRHRIDLIFKGLNPRAVICDAETQKALQTYEYHGKIYLYEDIIKTEIDDKALRQIRAKQLDIDPLYIVYTSGSTGVPKGVAACHRSVIDYIESLSQILDVDESTIFGNQTPLYVDACLKEL